MRLFDSKSAVSAEMQMKAPLMMMASVFLASGNLRKIASRICAVRPFARTATLPQRSIRIRVTQPSRAGIRTGLTTAQTSNGGETKSKNGLSVAQGPNGYYLRQG
jgi:hypothetical protein